MGRPPSWDDDQLRAAVAASNSMKEVVERLREEAGSAGYRAARIRVEVLDLDTSHFGRQPGGSRTPPEEGCDGSEQGVIRRRPRRWSDDALERAVATATSLNGVFTELGLVVGGTQWLVIRGCIIERGLDTSHWRRPLVRGVGPAPWTDADLRRVLPGSRSIAEILRRLGASASSGSQYARVRERLAALELDTSHLLGQGWARGTPNPSGVKPAPLEEVLVVGQIRHGGDIRRRLLEAGLVEPECAACKRTTWQGGPIPLELDHINGDRRDNRLENLRLLCPNCHALTDTYRGRNIGRYADEPPAEG